MAGATTCPECGARVSAYAAGCEACGADLEAHARRARLAAQHDEARVAARRVPRPRLPPVPVTRVEALYLAVTLFAVVFVSVLGIVLGLLGVLHGFYEQRPAWIAVCAALVAVALGLEVARL